MFRAGAGGEMSYPEASGMIHTQSSVPSKVALNSSVGIGMPWCLFALPRLVRYMRSKAAPKILTPPKAPSVLDFDFKHRGKLEHPGILSGKHYHEALSAIY